MEKWQEHVLIVYSFTLKTALKKRCYQTGYELISYYTVSLQCHNNSLYMYKLKHRITMSTVPVINEYMSRLS